MSLKACVHRWSIPAVVSQSFFRWFRPNPLPPCVLTPCRQLSIIKSLLSHLYRHYFFKQHGHRTQPQRMSPGGLLSVCGLMLCVLVHHLVSHLSFHQLRLCCDNVYRIDGRLVSSLATSRVCCALTHVAALACSGVLNIVIAIIYLRYRIHGAHGGM